MAKDFAKKFYRSKAWKKCREAYFISQHGLCELCDRPGEEVHHKTFLTPENIDDPDITLNWDKLQLLCRSCHSAEHDRAYNLYRAKMRKVMCTQNGYKFDEEGNLVENKNVFIVWGAPSSGKTSYVREHKGKYDIVIDLDYIMSALSMRDDGSINDDTLPFALDARDAMYKAIAERKHFIEKAWIIATLPDRLKREELKNRLKAELVHIDTSKEECLKRARMDDNRKDKQKRYNIIERYFELLEP